MSKTADLWQQKSCTEQAVSNVISIAQDLGYSPPHSRRTSSSQNTDKQTKLTVEFVALLKKLSAQKIELDRLLLENEKRQIDKTAMGLTHVEQQESWLSDVKELCSHLEVVTMHSTKIVERLQKPYSGSFVKVHYSQQKSVSQLLPLVCDTVARLEEDLSNMYQFKAEAGEVVFSLSEIEPAIVSKCAYLQSSLQSVLKLRELVDKERL